MNIQQALSRPFRNENRLDPAVLHHHMFTTYFNLRVWTGIVALLFPLVLWWGGRLVPEPPIELQGSMSAYYHTAMQPVFVGALLFIGAILLIYKGYSDAEDRALNLAGLFAFGVAAFPTLPPTGDQAFKAPVAHGTSAILFFLCIAYVCIWRSRDTVDFIRDPDVRRRYQRTYRTLGALMIALPIAAALLLNLLGRSTATFWVELAAVWVFGAYWLVKSFELRRKGAAAQVLEQQSRYRAPLTPSRIAN